VSAADTAPQAGPAAPVRPSSGLGGPGRARWRQLIGRPGAPMLLVGVGLLALTLRLGFGFRAPPFVTNDSLSYLLPGFDLAHGDVFAPLLKRPPLYPLFVGGVLGLFGEELRALTLIQHLLGVATVLVSYGIGRLLFGPAGGLIGAALTALSGPLIVTEQYLMSEALFTLLLAAGLLAYLGGVRGRHLGLLGLAGALLGLAALTRPIAQLALIVLLAALPILLPRWRTALFGALPMLALFGVVVLPWMIRNQQVQGTIALAGGAGEGLAVRTIRYDQHFDFREPPGGDSDRLLARARRIYRDEAADGSAFELARRLRDELGVSELEAERLMRAIALQAIVRQPGYYLLGTADMMLQSFAGRPVRLRQDWLPWRNIAWDERVRHLLPAPTAVEERSFAAAERLATLYDPARAAPLLAVLSLIGALSGLTPARRPALLVGVLVGVLLLAGAALIGIEWRYRFPLDPLINVLAAGGLVTLAGLARGGWRRAARSRGDRPLARPAGTTA
jgi:4-amino-4-deoxy-L-arabinose transferase-like glycosyltransferase